MGSKFAAALILAASMAAPLAHASDADEPGTVAKVRGIYVQLANGVLIEQQRAGRGVQLPAELRTEVGDLLTISESERAVAIKARWFTEEADGFGRAREKVASLFPR